MGISQMEERHLKEVVERAVGGDVEAFGRLVSEYQDTARRWACAIVGDLELAEDIVQDAFVQAHRSLGSLREPAAFRGWLRGVVRHCAHRYLRAKRLHVVSIDRAADVPSTSPPLHETAFRDEMRERVLEAIAALPEHEREATTLFYFQGYSQRDIAEILKVPVTTVNSRLSASRRRLKPRIAELVADSSVGKLSRSKEGRYIPASKLSEKETMMALQYEPVKRDLLRGDGKILIRLMTREDIPAVRGLNDEIDGNLDAYNAQTSPESSLNDGGGPWSKDEWLTEHLEKYRSSGNVTLLAEDDSGKLVGFADLWAANEPEPFGDSLNVECVDYLIDYYYAGLESIFLQEAEKVARAAGLPALDIGTNTCSGDYPSLRRFGLKVFYEYDNVTCRCRPVPETWKPSYRKLKVVGLDFSGVVKVDHWSPTDFTFDDEAERNWIGELEVKGCRVLLELLGSYNQREARDKPVPEFPPERVHLFAEPKALTSPEVFGAILRECSLIAGSLGAEKMDLPCPCEIELGGSPVDVTDRSYAFSWLRKEIS